MKLELRIVAKNDSIVFVRISINDATCGYITLSPQEYLDLRMLVCEGNMQIPRFKVYTDELK